MGYERQHYTKVRRQPRHASVSLCVVHCVDCRRPLVATHVVKRFGDRCRGCWDAFMVGAVHMASQFEGERSAEV